MLKRLNDALPELVLGIIVYGIVVELAGVWFVTDKLRYTTGLVIGIALAVGMAVNMAIVLRDAVEIYGGEHAQAKIIAKSILRYVIVVIVFFAYQQYIVILGYYETIQSVQYSQREDSVCQFTHTSPFHFLTL